MHGAQRGAWGKDSRSLRLAAEPTDNWTVIPALCLLFLILTLALVLPLLNGFDTSDRLLATGYHKLDND